MRILPTRRYRCREIKHVNLDRTMQPVDKDEYPVRELDLHDCNFFKWQDLLIGTKLHLLIY
jgi:hypothetical protein